MARVVASAASKANAREYMLRYRAKYADRIQEKKRRWDLANIDRLRAYHRAKVAGYKRRLVQEYGGRCEVCGTTDSPRVLPRDGKWPRVGRICGARAEVRLAAYPLMIVLCPDCRDKRVSEWWCAVVRHGTAHGYSRHGCRCRACCVAKSATQAKWRRRLRGRVAADHP